MYIIIIIGVNVVTNLNSVQVINKPCVCSRTMRLSTFCGLRRDQEHLLSVLVLLDYSRAHHPEGGQEAERPAPAVGRLELGKVGPHNGDTPSNPAHITGQ